MRLFLVIVLFFLMANCPLQALATSVPYPSFLLASGLKVIQLEHQVFVIEDQNGPAPAYSLIVEMSADQLLMVDAPYTPKYTKIVLNWMHAKWGAKHITAINTHYHLDRVGGNEVLAQAHIPVYGSDLTAALLSDPNAPNNKWVVGKDLSTYVSDPALKKTFQTMKIVAPTHLFPIKQGKILYLGNKKVEIFYPGPGHTPDNIVVYLPHLKLLFGGCLIVAFPKVFVVKDADVKSWPNSLATLKKFQVRWVIPGHPVSTEEDMNFSPALIAHTEMLFKNHLLTGFSKQATLAMKVKK